MGRHTDDIVMEKILKYSKNGQNSVFDIIDIDKVAQHSLSDHAFIKSVFVYCPFDKLTERLTERNHKAFSGEIDLSEVRTGGFPLLQYAELVRPRQLGDNEKNVIDRVTKKIVESDFDINFEAGIEALKRTSDGLKELAQIGKEGLLIKRAKEKRELLTAFGFTEQDPSNKTIELVLRKKYDLRIDTSDPRLGTTPVERGQTAAKRILGIRYEILII